MLNKINITLAALTVAVILLFSVYERLNPPPLAKLIIDSTKTKIDTSFLHRMTNGIPPSIENIVDTMSVPLLHQKLDSVTVLLQQNPGDKQLQLLFNQLYSEVMKGDSLSLLMEEISE